MKTITYKVKSNNSYGFSSITTYIIYCRQGVPKQIVIFLAVSFQYQYYVLVPYPIIVNEKVPKFYIYLQIIKHSLNQDTLHNEDTASGGGGVENTICQAMFRFEPPAKTYRHTRGQKNQRYGKQKAEPPPPTVSLKEFFRLSALMFCAAYNSMAYVFFFYTILGKTWDFFLFELKLNMLEVSKIQIDFSFYSSLLLVQTTNQLFSSKYEYTK